MTNHNQLPNPTTQAELSGEEQAIFTVAGAETWRSHRENVVNDQLAHLAAQGTIVDENTMNTLGSTADAEIDQYLVSSGLEVSSPNYSEIRENFLLAGQITNDAWNYSAASRGEQGGMPSGRDMFTQLVHERSTGPTEPEAEGQLTDTERQARDAEFASLEAELADVRELYAAAVAKRQGRLFGKGGKEHDRLKAEYEAKLHALGRRHMAEHPNYDDDTKRLIATTILFDEQEKLRDLTTDNLQGTKVSRVIDWMNKGNTVTRIGKGILVGAGAGLAGSFLAGAVGAGIVAGGTIAATRFARGFALKDADKRGMERYMIDDQGVYQGVDAEHYTVETDTSSMSDEERMSALMGKTHGGFEDDTKKEQGKRRKAAAYGTVLMGAGALVGYGIHELAERASDADLTATGWVREQWNDFWGTGDTSVNGRPDGVPSAEDHDGDGMLNGLDEDYDERTDGGLPNAGDLNQNDIPDVDEHGNGPDAHGDGNGSDLVGDTSNNADVVTIEHGHGYTHELIDLAEANGQHLTPEQAFELHKDLVDQFGQDYIDINGAGNDIYHQYGDIRLSESGAGRWEDGVPEFTAKWMDERGLWDRKVV